MTAQVHRTGRTIALGAGATSAHWIGEEALFTLSDGQVLVVPREGATRRIEAHDGVILSAALHPDGKRLVTGGDDGKLRALMPDGGVETIAELRKWVDHIVSSTVSGIIVAGVGKEAIVFREGSERHRFAHPSTIGGLALDAKGRRLAVSHYGGVSLRYALIADDKGATLKWAGSHLTVTVSPDGDYVVSAMQENALHGRRVADKLDLQMTGYPAKTRCFSWSKNGRWLATSGAEGAVIWPFVGKMGPQGKEPLTLGARRALVTAVAFHPSEESVAIGYGDGAAALARLAEDTGAELDEPGEGAVTALAWSADGKRISIGDEAGRAAIVEVG